MSSRVLARDRVWRVQSASPVSDRQTLYRLLDHETGETLDVLAPPESVTPLNAGPPNLARGALAPFSVWAEDHTTVRLSCLATERPVAAFSGRIIPEPYQFVPVQRLLASQRASLLIADDVGLGKTVEAGIILHELMARGRGQRILLVVPPGLIPQWQDEMLTKFGLAFRSLEDSAAVLRAQTELTEGVRPWEFLDRVITSTEFLKKRDILRPALKRPWDVIVADEAHYLAESGTPRHPYQTARARMGAALRQACHSLVLLTATPHNGYGHSFRSLIELVEPTDAVLSGNPEVLARRVGRTMIRRLKPQIFRTGNDGRHLPAFVPREPVRALAVADLCRTEKQLFRKVSSYCARTAKAAAGEDDSDLVSFAMQIIKKRMLSSRQALRVTLQHRIEAVKARQTEEEPPTRAEVRELQGDLPIPELTQDRIAQQVLRAAVPREAKRRAAEKNRLDEIAGLLAGLDDVPDAKIATLVKDLREQVFSVPGEKAIVFTEYRDTLAAIKAEIGHEPALAEVCVELTGGLSIRQRQSRLAEFARPTARLLLATDAASEGLNLQHLCRRVYHVELPWNPNRMEQRNGRVDRHGQTRPPVVSYLHYPDSPEDGVLNSLVRKITEMQQDRVSTPDILGLLAGARIEEALTGIDAERDDATEVRSLFRVIDENRTEFLREVAPILALGEATYGTGSAGGEKWLSADPLTADDEALDALLLARFGGALRPTVTPAVWTLETPAALRGPGVRDRYAAITFRRSVALRFPARDVEYVHRLHPLAQAVMADALARLTGERAASALAPRLAVRRHILASDGAFAVFTYLVRDGFRNLDVLGLPVRPDGAVITEPAYGQLPLQPCTPAGEVPWPELEAVFGAGFAAVQAIAVAAAAARAGGLSRERLSQRQALAGLLREDAESYRTDRLAEIDREERAAKTDGTPETQGQLLLFGDPDDRGFAARRAAVETFHHQRLVELDGFATAPATLTAEALGVLFVFPPQPSATE